MDDIPLPGLSPGDPQNRLSSDARRRISRALVESEKFIYKAEIAIGSKRLTPDAIIAKRGEARFKKAQLVLTVMQAEYSKLHLPLSEYQQCMKEEIEGASNSMELSAIERRLLETEFFFPTKPTQKTSQSQNQLAERLRSLEVEVERLNSEPPQRGLSARLEAFAIRTDEMMWRKVERDAEAERIGKDTAQILDQPRKQGTVGEQIDRLREECEDMSIEELAEKMDIDPTNVSRHIRDESKPSRKNLRKYERLFSKLLDREVVITKTQLKRS